MVDDILYDKHITCLYCNQSFISKRMRISKIKTSKKDTDFCTYFVGENPLLYEFYICPSCGLAFTDSFSAIKGMHRERIKTEYISKISVPNLCATRTLEDAIKGYKLALLCANILDEKIFILANLCLRIAWLYRYTGHHEEEMRFMQNAVTLYEEIYQTQSSDKLGMEEGRLLYLIGELNSRLGHFEKTRQLFGHVLMDKSLDSKWKKYVRERWYDIKASNTIQTDDPEGYNEA